MRTSEKLVSASAFADSKPHYMLLDAMRGVAALVVIWYHIFEGFATSAMDQRINHGYLAVDFFFILSGFILCHTLNIKSNLSEIFWIVIFCTAVA